MILKTLIITLLFSDSTLELPVKNGKLIQVEHSIPTSVEIEVTSDLNIYSLHDGKVKKVTKSENFGVNIFIFDLLSNLTYCYTLLDNCNVSNGQKIFKGQVIGSKKNLNESIVLKIFDGKKMINPLKYLVYQRLPSPETSPCQANE